MNFWGASPLVVCHFSVKGGRTHWAELKQPKIIRIHLLELQTPNAGSDFVYARNDRRIHLIVKTNICEVKNSKLYETSTTLNDAT